jgi:hypothetical protein
MEELLKKRFCSIQQPNDLHRLSEINPKETEKQRYSMNVNLNMNKSNLQRKVSRSLDARPNKSRKGKKSSFSMEMDNNILDELKFLPNVNLFKELEDPDNVIVKEEIQRLITIHREVEVLEGDYKYIQRSKSADAKMLEEMRQKEIMINQSGTFRYSYISYLKGLKEVIEDYLSKLPKPGKLAQLNGTLGINNKTILLTGTSSPLVIFILNCFINIEKK